MFEGPKSGTLFVVWQGSGHYTFSLKVDFFTIEGMRVWGANTLAGIISLACLNLPLQAGEHVSQDHSSTKRTTPLL